MADDRPRDVTERLRLHMEYSAKRDAAARRAIALLEEGNPHAHEVAEEAERWDLKVKSLEPRR